MATMLTIDRPDIAVDHERLVERTIFLMRTSDESLTLDALSETVGLSPFYFARIFRSIAGIPPGEFQSALRFERAKSLLLTTDASVTDICFEVGYDSLGTFSSRFKKLVGVGPAEFRVMPDIMAGMNIQGNYTCNRRRHAGTSAEVWGTVQVPAAHASHIYIGLFPDGIARSRPVAGLMLVQPGPFMLSNLPVGVYHLLAAALPASGNPLDQLVPNGATLVGEGAPIVVRSGTERIHRELTLRSLKLTDPPVLTALPALLL
jgi:AraC family transcriptional regulator